MRVVALGLLLVCAAVWGGCGDEASELASAPGSPSATLLGPEGGRAPAASPEAAAADATLTPVGRALAAWMRARPLHLALSITHTLQSRDRIWTGDVEEWRRQTPPAPAPLQVEAWAGDGERAAFTPDAVAAFSFYAGKGDPEIALGSKPAAGVTRVPGGWVRHGGDTWMSVEELASGWRGEAPPSVGRLAAALDVLLDPLRLHDWLANVLAWSTATDGVGTAYHAMARGASGSLGREVDVKIVLGERDQILRLEVEVRVDRSPRMLLDLSASRPQELRPGSGAWDAPFPRPPLLLPGDVLGGSRAKGDPTLGDVAHERTSFVLRPDPNPLSPAFEKFLSAQRARR